MAEQKNSWKVGGKALSLRGRTFVGKVVSERMMSTVTVEWDGRKYIPKYQRYEKRRTRVKAHNPKEINARVGDMVRIVETRPISKTKNFIVVEILTDEEVAKVSASAKSEPKTEKKAAEKPKKPAKKTIKTEKTEKKDE
ncbi:30S ribosomal protein S17 [Candidatus Woesearchaeota archaeon]|nr:30S ribosomal protein S17 [Candidatus Woesearchaeota archaeon]